MAFAIYIKKYIKTKEELWKYKYFTMQKYNLQKILWKKPKILQAIINQSQVSTQAKISAFKNPHIKIDLLLPRDQNPLSYYTLYNESKHNILACWVGKVNKALVKKSYHEKAAALRLTLYLWTHPNPNNNNNFLVSNPNQNFDYWSRFAAAAAAARSSFFWKRSKTLNIIPSQKKLFYITRLDQMWW